jgi:hypothetical protein
VAFISELDHSRYVSGRSCVRGPSPAHQRNGIADAISERMSEPRRFPPPWSVDDSDMKLGQECFIVCDVNGQAHDDVVKYCFPMTWPADREQRARSIGEWLKTEARYLAS